MENFFKFFDDLSVEETQYWRLKVNMPKGELLPTEHNLNTRGVQGPVLSIELLWQRSKKPFSWSFRLYGDQEWTPSSTILLENRLISLGVSREQLQAEITSQIMTQVVHAQMVIDAGHKLLGPHVVQQATRQTQDFLMSLQTMTDALLNGKPQEFTKDQGKTQGGKSHLKLVKGEPLAEAQSSSSTSSPQPIDIDLDWEYDI